MRSLLTLILVLVGPACFGGVPAKRLGSPLPNGCVIHAMLYMASLDPDAGTAEMVRVVGGGGVPHVIVVVSSPDGRRFGRDEDLGVFALGELSPQAAFDAARRQAIASRAFRGGALSVGRHEARRSLRAAFELLQAAGFQPTRVGEVVVWRMGAMAYVYSPRRGCAEIRTCSRNLMRIASVAVRYWTSRP